MRFFVESGGKSYVIPCKDGKESVASLKRQVLARCVAVVAKSEAAAASAQEARYDLILKSGGAVLCDQDVVEDVLQDGDTLSLRELLRTITVSYRLVRLVEPVNPRIHKSHYWCKFPLTGMLSAVFNS